MNIKECILERRSIRIFKDKLVPYGIIKEILDVARWAPSNCNTQSWRFIIITSQKLKKKIVDMGGSRMILNAPISILILYENTSDNIEYKDYIQSSAAAIQNICLYAHSKEIGSCWINHLPKKDHLQKLFKLPKELESIGLVLMGYPKNKSHKVLRKNKIEEIIGINKINLINYKKNKISPIKKILRKLYYMTPTKIKKIVNPIIDKKLVKKFKN